MIKKVWKKIKFEIRMYIIDTRWRNQWFHCWEMYPPSFYYRYTPDEQKQIRDRDIAEIRAMLEEYKEKHGVGNKNICSV